MFNNLKYFTIFGQGEKLTADLLKNLWRKVCVKVHPDKGGTHESYLEAQAEYQYLLAHVGATFTAASDSPEAYADFREFLANISPAVRSAVAAAGAIDGIRLIEITGYWVWVSIGREQVTERAALKAINVDGKRFSFHGGEKKWVWKGVQASGWKRMDWEEKKAFWGYDKYEKEGAKQIA